MALWTPAGRAEEIDPATRTAARELARQGADAFEQADYTTALDRLNRAYSLIHAPSISVMQARALARLGRLVEALDRYEETQRVPLGSDSPEAYRKAVNDAKVEGEELRARIPRLAIHVRSDHGSPPGLNVLLDGKPVPAALLDVDRPVDLGTHEVTAAAPGYRSATRTLSLVEHEVASVDLKLEAMVTSAPSAPPVVTDTAPNRTSVRTRTWGWVTLGVAAAGLATSGITGIIALNKKSTLDDARCTDPSSCIPGSTAPQHEQDIDSFRAMRTVSYVTLAIGVASAGVGTYLLWSGSRESPRLAASVGPTTVSLWGAF